MRQLTSMVAGFLLLAAGCGEDRAPDQVSVPGRPGATKTSATARTARRAFDGAPPVIPHQPHGAACIACHSGAGMAVEGLGFAPPNPHGAAQDGAMSRCVQCHVYRSAEGEFVASGFAGLRRDAARTDRAHEAAPPTIPHPLQLRENCAACHTGPAAREEIRCSHPERARCVQCHVPQAEVPAFRR